MPTTLTTLPAKVEITEVGLRDGFQSIKEWIPTGIKREIAELLIACGFRKIEATAFVSPKAIPQMADAAELLQGLKQAHPDVCLAALTPNLKGVTNAIAAGADEVTYIVSASERHNQENTRQSIAQSLQGLHDVMQVKDAASLYLAIPTAFICPWTGKVPHDNVLRIIEHGLSAGVDSFGVADTIGAADPRMVAELATLLHERFPQASIGYHFHDTRGMGLANVLAAIQSGATRFESSIGGLGGCPFAPGAAGNIATEDLVNMLDSMGIQTGIDREALLRAVYRSEELLPVPLAGRLGKAFSCATH